MIGAIMFVLLIGLMFIGVPIAFSMGLSSVIMLLINPTASMIAIVQKSVNGLDSFTTLAIPFFMMASFILTGSGVGIKIFRFAGTLVRHLTGGLAHVNVLTSMIMAGMSRRLEMKSLQYVLSRVMIMEIHLWRGISILGGGQKM